MILAPIPQSLVCVQTVALVRGGKCFSRCFPESEARLPIAVCWPASTISRFEGTRTKQRGSLGASRHSLCLRGSRRRRVYMSTKQRLPPFGDSSAQLRDGGADA